MKVASHFLSLSKNFVGIIIATTFLSSLGSAQTILLENDFGPGADTGPAFQELTNGVLLGGVGGSFDPLTGVVVTSPNGSNTTGTNTVATISASIFEGFTVEYVVESADLDPDDNGINNVNANGFFFGIASGTDATGTTGDSLFNNNPLGIGVVFQEQNAFNSFTFRVDGVDNGTVVEENLFGDDGDVFGEGIFDQFEDGFTLSLTFLDDDTVTVTSTGLAATGATGDPIGELDFTTTLPTGTVFEDFAGAFVPNTTIQGGNLTFDLGSVTVTSVEPVVVPEPTSALLLLVSGLGIATSRRRR